MKIPHSPGRQPRRASGSLDSRPLIRVACGVLRRADGEVLLAQRPPGKLAAGKWEFPGGKIEPGETPYQALQRELDEELGVRVRSATPLAHLRQDYADRQVWLDTWLVESFDGVPESREGQCLQWTTAKQIADFDVLPSCWRVAAALQLSRDYVFTAPQATAAQVLDGLAQLPRGTLLRLRLPSWDDGAYAALAAQVIAAGRAFELSVVLDRAPAQVQALGAAGWHASTQALRNIAQRPLPQGCWFLASAHDAEEIATAHALGADAVVIAPVLPTRTHPQAATTLGWPGFAALAARAGLPAYALGGIGPADRALATDHGAFGIAGISAWWPAGF